MRSACERRPIVASPYMFLRSAKTRSHEAEFGESAKATRDASAQAGNMVGTVDKPPLEKLLCIISNTLLVRRLIRRTDAAPSEELGGLWRGNCRWPFTCCNKNRPRWAQDEHGSRRKSPRSPPGADGKDKESDAPTPKRAKTVQRD